MGALFLVVCPGNRQNPASLAGGEDFLHLPVICEISVAELQETGHLAQTDIRMIPIALRSRRMIFDGTLDENALPVGWRETSYNELYLEDIVMNGWRNKRLLLWQPGRGERRVRSLPVKVALGPYAAAVLLVINFSRGEKLIAP